MTADLGAAKVRPERSKSRWVGKFRQSSDPAPAPAPARSSSTPEYGLSPCQPWQPSAKLRRGFGFRACERMADGLTERARFSPRASVLPAMPCHSIQLVHPRGIVLWASSPSLRSWRLEASRVIPWTKAIVWLRPGQILRVLESNTQQDSRAHMFKRCLSPTIWHKCRLCSALLCAKLLASCTLTCVLICSIACLRYVPCAGKFRLGPRTPQKSGPA